MQTSILLIFAFALVLAGFALVLSGSGIPGSSGGCFIWPFPIIIACSAGSGGTPYLLIIGSLVVAFISLLSFVWMRKAIGDSTVPSPDDSGSSGQTP